MRGRMLLVALLVLCLALTAAAMVVVENAAKNSARREFMELIRREQLVCQSQNLELEEGEPPQDCSFYGDLLYRINHPES